VPFTVYNLHTCKQAKTRAHTHEHTGRTDYCCCLRSNISYIHTMNLLSHLYTRVHVRMQRMHLHIFTFAYSCSALTHTHTHTHTHTNTHIHIHTRLHTHAVHVLTHTHIYTRLRTHAVHVLTWRCSYGKRCERRTLQPPLDRLRRVWVIQERACVCVCVCVCVCAHVRVGAHTGMCAHVHV
jgi:hypothetical protein